MASPASMPTAETQRPLSESIGVATRSAHSKLNKLIIARLPLAIPPRAADPSSYVSGLIHIAPVYAAFESLWEDIVASPTSPPGPTQGQTSMLDPDHTLPVSHVGTTSNRQSAASERIYGILKALHLPGLMRSQRLRSDISSMTGWSSEEVDEQLKVASTSGRLAEFMAHIKRVIDKKPHVLLAYSYILFMALFAGGRFIRATLESAGSEFWEQVPSPISPSLAACRPRPTKTEETAAASRSMPADFTRGERGILETGASHSRHSLPLSFFHFATVLDGEDLKKEFKKRLAESESLLTAQERHDIIQEAVCIFENMLLLVGQLDDVCEANSEDDASAIASMAAWASLGPGSRLRDSVLVTRERRNKASSRDSGHSNGKNSWLCRHARQQKSEASGISEPDLEKQPPVCCPASGSMRFEANLPVPARKVAGKTHLADGLVNAHPPMGSVTGPSRSSIAQVLNIVLVAGMAAIVGFFFLSRRSVDENSTVDADW